jgi:5-methyltetrahydrofolate--homocysteine methyltransferase
MQDKLNSIELWWHCENTVALIAIDSQNSLNMEAFSKLNQYWPNADAEPDFENLAESWKHIIPDRSIGATLPTVRHLFGKRGASMAMSYYLGGHLSLGDNTVWVEPIARDLNDLNQIFDPTNIWFKRSLTHMKTLCSTLCNHCLVAMPDFGDALTCLSLLIGTEKLLTDLIDNEKAVKKAIEQFSELWPQYHKPFWDVYLQYYHGDCNPLIWAPGKTYTVQCDFSTMISPAQFKHFVVPELEKLSNYLDYMVWHLDGPEEIRHLETILDLPFIKAIQWVPGAAHPTAGAWVDMLDRIQKKNKAIYCYSGSEDETDFLINNLSSQGLFVQGCY